MHPEALAWVAECAQLLPVDPASVLDIGGRNINGTPRHLFPAAVASGQYVTLDALPGADITADAATWHPDQKYAAVVCTEVFEHTPVWREILATAYDAVESGGFLIATCAGLGRAPHSGHDGGHVRNGEHYANVTASGLRLGLEAAGWEVLECRELGTDTQAIARHP